MTVESPCLKVCVMDPASTFCIGCGRTISEIASWSRLSDADKRSVVNALPERLKAMTSREVRGRRTKPPES
jgi:uncharacterized protein